MVKIRLRFGLLLFVLGVVLGAAAVFGFDRLPARSLGAQLAITQRDLGSARRDLESARANGADLERRLSAAQDSARAGAAAFDAALLSASRLSDTGERIVVLARAGRALSASLRAILGISPIPGPAP